jgi:hypothetical protein
MPNGVGNGDVPPPQRRKRGTPRSLSQTLRNFRVAGTHRPPQDLAACLHVGESTLRKWERPPQEYSIKFRALQKYQDHYGVPVGIIVAISQILAAARDNRDDHLQVYAAMLKFLLRRIDTPRRRKDAIARVLQNRRGPRQTTYSDWDNLLTILVIGAWGCVDGRLLESYKNEARLKLR